jgi:hypothetical protein
VRAVGDLRAVCSAAIHLHNNREASRSAVGKGRQGT